MSQRGGSGSVGDRARGRPGRREHRVLVTPQGLVPSQTRLERRLGAAVPAPPGPALEIGGVAQFLGYTVSVPVGLTSVRWATPSIRVRSG